MPPTIDVPFHEYVRGVRTTGPGALVLAARLIKAAPSDLGGEERAALHAIEASAESVREVLAERDRVGPARVRVLLTKQAADWNAFHGALLAKAHIPAEVSDVGARAQAVLDSLFPDGVSFLGLPAESAWAEADRRIQRVTDEKLKKEIEQLIGPEFLPTVMLSTAAVGDAIGTGASPRPIPSTTALYERLAEFGHAVGVYGRLLTAGCDATDPESVQRFRAAVAPMDLHRVQRRAGSATASAPPAPTVSDQMPDAQLAGDPTHAVHPGAASTTPAIGITADHVTVTQSSVGTIAAPTNGAANGAATLPLRGGSAAA